MLKPKVWLGRSERRQIAGLRWTQALPVSSPRLHGQLLMPLVPEHHSFANILALCGFGAKDLMARGIDAEKVDVVVNLDLPVEKDPGLS